MDAGNLLFKKGDSGNNPVAMITAHGIVRTYGTLSYDAVAVSPQDMNAGRAFFRASQANGFPWISANIFDDDERLVFSPTVVIKRTGAPDVGIIGLTGKSENNSFWARIGDWRETLPEHLAQLESTCGLLILLSNLSDDENSEIAKMYPQIDVIVASSPTRYGNQAPQVVGDSLITQSDGRGTYLGKLELKWHPQGSWLATSPTESHERLQEKVAAIELQIKKYQEGKSEADQEYDKKLTEMLNSKQSVEDRITSLESVIAEQKEPVFTNTFNSTFLPVKPRPSGNEVDTIVQDIKKSISAYQKTRLKEKGQIDQQAGEALQLSQFAGVAACTSCHEKQFAFWTETAHARAFATLVNTGQNYNPECLPCHVTGGSISPVSSFAKKDLLLVLPEDRQAVGCEVCHGPGRQHSLNPGNVLPTRKPAEQKCINCHTPEHDDDFDFSTKMNKTACPPTHN